VLTVLLSVALSQASPSHARPMLPVQGDLSLTAGLGERSAAGVAAYLGFASGSLRPGANAPFGGIGFEYSQASSGLPFRASGGVQLRAGWAWSGDRRAAHLHPDVFLYARVTPFVGGSTGLGDGTPYPRYGAPAVEPVIGVRVGVGLTAPWWTRTFLFQRPFEDERGFYGETLRVLSGVLLAPFALVNHGELVAEVLLNQPEASTLTLRVGTGF